MPSEKPKSEPKTEPKEPFIRPCGDYRDEYKACKSLENRIQHYYAYGRWIKKADCVNWKEMYDLCKQCKRGDVEAKEKLAGMEQALTDDIVRRRTDIWTYRDEPPRMWHFPGKSRAQAKSEATN